MHPAACVRRAGGQVRVPSISRARTGKATPGEGCIRIANGDASNRSKRNGSAATDTLAGG